ncbi:MAG TPA: DEAD/DEAH box helicase, partial [Verrucomicrobiae bacterium]|nr:DEAD/DEAH box helicase [Verrucomicrobiae bacterium]
MASFAEQLGNLSLLNQVTVPDLWQQEAVAGLRSGKDVVVQAPTGSGKTLIFELWSNAGKNRGQAIYTVPTRALANDKLAEWRARGWDVGIATGDLAENLGAPILVATLETQKNRLIQGDGPSLLVVDEYQMIGDPDRGLNYELALALAPPQTQLLLLSGSVGNPQDIVKWLRRLGRDALLIRSDHRPVPLDEVNGNNLNYHVPSEIRGYWPRLVAKALAENLGPILIFAPRRQAAESLAAELTRYLPTPNPLTLRLDQKQLVGEHLAKMLKSRIAYHHSGLSYAARAGVIEPLAKAGQLRVVVATMGLAAGINFSLRSVALAGESYRRDYVEHPLRPDEILQMFGRAGRRGIDEVGYVVVSANQIRLREGYPAHLSRSGMVDWGALLGLMRAAADQGRDPFTEAVRVQERLFSTKPIFLGVEESLKHPVVPCGLKTDAERGRHVRKRVREMLNSRGEWELMPNPSERPLREICVMERPDSPSGFAGAKESRGKDDVSAPPENLIRLPGSDRTTNAPFGSPSVVEQKVRPHPDPLPQEREISERIPVLRPVLSEPAALEKTGTGILTIVSHEGDLPIYGRSITVAESLNDNRILLVKWIRRLTRWNGRQAPMELWNQKIVPLLEEKLAATKTPVVRVETQGHKIIALVSLADLSMRVPVDSYGIALWRPVERDVLPPDCARCSLVPVCRQLSTQTGVAMLWRRLGLVDTAGTPTLRGRVVSFFSQGYGLAIAAALEGKSYALDELIYDLANLDAGFRFCGEENRWAGRLPMACRQIYGIQSIPGYLENGVPPKYGSGAEQIVSSIHKNPLSKSAWITELLGAGDIDRVIIEWRSILRQISHAPQLDWARWSALQAM